LITAEPCFPVPPMMMILRCVCCDDIFFLAYVTTCTLIFVFLLFRFTEAFYAFFFLSQLGLKKERKEKKKKVVYCMKVTHSIKKGEVQVTLLIFSTHVRRSDKVLRETACSTKF
jgi:hypothetical protein